MNSARKLLVPIDFSEACKTVIKYALNEKQHKSDHLVLLHSYRLISDEFSSYRDSPRALKKKLEKRLLETYKTFNQNLPYSDIRKEIEFKLEVGFTVNSIHSICQESRIDLILYALKSNKENKVLADLMTLDCPPVMLIPEGIDAELGLPLTNTEIDRKTFNENWDQYIKELESNPKISYTILPY